MAPLAPSPLALRVGRTLFRALGGEEVAVSTDLGLPSYDPRKTTQADDGKRSRDDVGRATARAIYEESYDRTRLRDYGEYLEMRDEDSALDSSASTIVDFVFGGDPWGGPANAGQALIVEFADDARPEVVEVVERTTTRLNLPQWARDVFDQGITLGDSFSELIFTADDLVDQKNLPPEGTRVVWDRWSRLVGYTHVAGTVASPLSEPSLLAPWQVVHYAHGRRRGNRYGRSMFVSARRPFRGSQTAEDVMSLLVLLRAANRKSVSFEVPSGADSAQIDALTKEFGGSIKASTFFDSGGTLRRRLAAILSLDDWLYPYRRGTSPPEFHDEPPADLRQVLEVVRHHQESAFVATGVPAALAGVERNINARATLEEQGLQFARRVNHYHRDVAILTSDVLIRALGANSITPRPGEVQVRMAPSSHFNELLKARVSLIRANAAKLLAVDVELSTAFTLRHVLGLSDAQVIAALDRTGEEGGANPEGDGAREEIEARCPEIMKKIDALADIFRTLHDPVRIDVSTLVGETL